MARGIARERQVRRLLEADGYWTARAAGSLGEADVIALRAGDPPLMIEVKTTSASPFNDFGPADRAALSSAAARAGAQAWLYWWPPRRPLRRIPQAQWPAERRRAA